MAIKHGRLNIVHYFLEEQQLSPLTQLKVSYMYVHCCTSLKVCPILCEWLTIIVYLISIGHECIYAKGIGRTDSFGCW